MLATISSLPTPTFMCAEVDMTGMATFGATARLICWKFWSVRYMSAELPPPPPPPAAT